MPRQLLLAVFCSAAVATHAQSRAFTTSEAKQHVGSVATVCGKVLSPRFASSTKGQPTFLNLDKPYPNQEFTVVIWGSDRPKFGVPEVVYRDKSVCVTGAITAYRGGAEIVATDPKQIQVQQQKR